MKHNRLPFQLEIVKPCEASWAEMKGTLSQRHCQSCDKSVHNFAAMTSKAIEKIVFESDGRMCARIVRRADGSLVTAEPTTTPHASRAASLLVGVALSTGAALADEPNPNDAKAIVSGSVRGYEGKPLTYPAHVLFISNGQSVVETVTDSLGHWKAELVPGTYDVVFRSGQIMGERVNAVQLHPGEQSFSMVTERVAVGHLGSIDAEPVTFTVGEVVAIHRYPISYLVKHPLRYLKNLTHNFS